MLPMGNIDYSKGIDCPDNCDDEQALMDYVVAGDCELCYLDAYLGETFKS